MKYSDIIAIDPATNVPIRHESHSDVVWRTRGNSGNSLIEAIGQSDSGVQGHFTGRRRHVLHYVLNDRLIEAYRDSICEAVQTAVSTFAEIDHNVKECPVSHIVYPEYTIGIEALVQGLVRRFPGSRPVGVDWNDLRPPVTLPSFHDSAGTVIVLDDVLSSGFTIWQLIDLAEINKAKATCAFVLLDRSDEWTARLLRRNQEYGGSTLHVAFLAQLSIPTFLPIDCPACARQRRLKEARHSYGSCDPLRELIEREIDSNREREIRHLQTSQVRNAALARDLSERIRSFKVRELLELSIRNGSIRTTLYDLIAQDPEYANAFYEIVVQEETWIKTADFASVMNEQLQDLVRRHFADALNAIEIDSKSLETVIAAFRIIDPEGFVDAINVATLLNMPEAAAARVWLELSFTPHVRSYERFIETTLNKWSAQVDAPWASSLAQAWSKHFDGSKRVKDGFLAYRDVLLALDDSGECAQAIAELEWRRIESFTFDERQAVLAKWELLVMIIRQKVLRFARELVFGEEPQLSVILHDRLSFVSDLLTNGSALVDVLRSDPAASEGAVDAFKNLVDELYNVCIRDGENSLPSTLRSYQVRLSSIISKMMTRWSDSLAEQRIEVSVDVDPELVVFGPEHFVNGVAYALIENVLTRAFPPEHEGPRLVTVVAAQENGMVNFRVADTGVGSEKYGPRGGLRTLARLGRDICEHVDIRRGTPGTVAEVNFFRIGEDMR